MTSLPDTKTLDLELSNCWLTVWFNSPLDNRNTLTEARSGEFSTLCDALVGASYIRGVTFRGCESMFCAGGNLKSFKQAVSGQADRDDTLEMSRRAGALYGAINTLPQIAVMAVEGPCMAGGLGIAACEDTVIAERDATFSLTEVRIGLSPAQIAPFVTARIGIANMRRLVLTGAMFGSEVAMKIGLADRIVEGSAVMGEAVAEIVEQTTACAPGAVAATKRRRIDITIMSRQAQIDTAAKTFTDCMFSAEGRESLTAFAEKRKPDWHAPQKEVS